MTAAPTNAMTGRMLGDFVVHQQIGAGGFGAVYLAEQVSLGREAVIKIPLARADADSAFAAQFLREAQFASQLDHPYAAHIYAFGVEEDGTLWTAMELVRGTPLNELLKQHGPLPVEKFVPLFDKLCEVVHTAHDQGIIHRDLKPANVMVIARAGRLLPKLLDLGIAKLSSVHLGSDPNESGAPGSSESSGAGESLEAGTSAPGETSAFGSGSGGGTQATSALGASRILGATENISAKPTVGPAGLTKLRAMTLDASMVPQQKSDTVGTPAYMAPEQWVPSIPTDARTDVYALGILAYEVLTGRLPFMGKNSMELARAHARATVPPLGGDLPPALNAVIATALAKRPDKRYQSAVEFAAAMRKATGFDQEPVKLPALDAALREALLATAPQPLAEAVSALDSVRNAHQGLSAVFQIMRVTTRLLGNLSLACWTHYGTLAERGHPEVARALGQLKRHGLDEMEWMDLSELIAVQFTDRRASAPLPELIELFCPDTARTTSRNSDEPSEGTAVSRAMRAIVATKDHYETALAPDAATTKRLLEETMPQLQVALAGLAWLHDYLLVVPHGETADRWMGTRRQPRPVVPLQPGAEVTDNEPMLVTQDGAPVLRLAPFFQAAAPAPGQDAELFVLDGSGRSGARLVSMPTGFEKSDHALWGWLGTQVAIEALDSERKGNERAPYRGLAAFTADDADMFVGRERETEAVANRLRITAMLGIVGPSGAGKSSFIQAGVLPALGSHWKSVIVRPGGSPLLALRTMVRGLEGLEDTTDEALAGSGLGNVLRAWATARKQSLMLYVDQFEELFTLCHDVAERKAYVDMLLHASLSPADPLRVVFTVRDDFLLRCQQLEALRDRLVSGLQLLSTPTPDDLLRILIEPARRAGYEFDDPALPGEMVQAIADMPSALPLLSFTAAQLWELRDRQASKLARKAYESLGGVGGALAQHAERVLGGMSPEAQGLVRIVFRNLVTADGTRAILTRAEALEILGNHADAETTLEALIHARLLTASEGAGALDRIEVVHEALLSAWPRLINWRREDAEGARMRDQLRAAARQWDERGRPRGLLWRDETLTEYTIWRSRNPGNLTGVEAAFGAASIAEAARSRRLRRIAISTIFASLTIGMIVSLFMFRKAETSREVAADQLTASYVDQGRRFLLENDAASSLLYLTEAWRRGSNDTLIPLLLALVVEPLKSEVAVISPPFGKTTAAKYAPNGKHVLIAGSDGSITIWKSESASIVATWNAHPGGRVDVVWLNDEQFVSCGADSTMKLWTLGNRTPVKTGSIDKDLPIFLYFNSRRREVVVVTSNSSLRAWNVDTGVSTLLKDNPVDSEMYFSVAIASRSGAMVIVGSTLDGSNIVSEIVDGNAPSLPLTGLTFPPYTIEYSPDERMVAGIFSNGTVKIWDAASGRIIRSLEGHYAAVKAVAWSHDSKQLVTGSADQTVRVWNLETGSHIALHGHTGDVAQLLFLRNDQYLASASSDGTAKLWESSSGTLTTLFHGGRIKFLDAAEQGNQLLTLSTLGSVKLWHIDPPRSMRVLGPTANASYYEPSPVISRSGMLARATDEGVAMWGLVSGEKVELPDNQDPVVGVALVSDETTLVAASGEGDLRAYDLQSKTLKWRRQAPIGHARLAAMASSSSGMIVTSDSLGELRWFNEFGVLLSSERLPAPGTTLDWSKNGATVAVSLRNTDQREIMLFDGYSRRRLATLPSKYADAAISPDGKYLVTATQASSTIEIWDRHGTMLKALEQSSFITSFEISETGDKLLAGGLDGSVQVWAFPSGEQLAVLPAKGSNIRDISVTHDGRYSFVLDSKGTVFVWDLLRYRYAAHKSTDSEASRVLSDPSKTFLVTMTASKFYVRPIGELSQQVLRSNLLRELACRIPKSVREQTVSTLQCP